MTFPLKGCVQYVQDDDGTGRGAPLCSPFVILLLSHYPFIVQSELSLIISTKGPAPSSRLPHRLKCNIYYFCRVFDQYEIDIEVKKHRHSYLGKNLDSL
jgi:hypothetical protein